MEPGPVRRYYGDWQSTIWVRGIAGTPGSVQRLGTAEALRLPLQAPTPRPEGRLDALGEGRSGVPAERQQQRARFYRLNTLLGLGSPFSPIYAGLSRRDCPPLPLAGAYFADAAKAALERDWTRRRNGHLPGGYVRPRRSSRKGAAAEAPK
jgi:hypothetical protein